MKLPGLLIATLMLGGCDRASWQGWVYPDRNDLSDDIPIGAFDTLEQCGAAARTILKRLDVRDEDGEQVVGDYECGYKCKPEGGAGGLNVCEKTER